MKAFVFRTDTGPWILFDHGQGIASAGKIRFEGMPPGETLRFDWSVENVQTYGGDVWCGPRHLWTIAAQWAEIGVPDVYADRVGEMLFLPHYRPNVADIFDVIDRDHDPAALWWNAGASRAHYSERYAKVFPGPDKRGRRTQ